MLPFIPYHKTLVTNVLLMFSKGEKNWNVKKKSVFEDSVCPVSVFYVPNTNWAVRSYAAYEIVAFTLDRQTLLSPPWRLCS